MSLGPGARVTVLTGAGVSVASGLRPYRGPGGLWDEFEIERVATAEAIAARPVECWRAHRDWARLVGRALPNAAHEALAALEARPDVGRVTVITQNVDSLHQRAGSREVVEVHGSLARVRCASDTCDQTPFAAPPPDEAPDEPPPCVRCGGPLRYDITLFGEFLSPEAERAAQQALRACDYFLAVGTSGLVYPAASYAREAHYAGARTVLVNLEPASPPNPYFLDNYLGRAEELLPVLFAGPSAAEPSQGAR
jgi:NAD-dependent protein deacetylase/lipoamidase